MGFLTDITKNVLNKFTLPPVTEIPIPQTPSIT